MKSYGPLEAPDAASLAALATPAAYPGDPSAAEGVSWIQTHLSHVFLTGEWVYKFRKPVDLGFVRFATREERNTDCLREVALNRRLAPDVYQGIAPLLAEDGSVHVGPPSEDLHHSGGVVSEHCVVMRRLPDGRDALSLLERGELSHAQLDRFAELVAAFHAQHRLGTPAPFTAEEWRERILGPVEDNFRMLGGSGAERALVAEVRTHAEEFVACHPDRFERRRVAGRAVDGHGDLHLQHVWFERDDAEPLLIDCLQFNERLRRIDAASEVAFTAMDLRYRGAGDRAERFLRRYARESDDFELYTVVDYFEAYRATVRAKVAAITSREEEIAAEQRAGAAESARRHLALAASILAPRSAPPLVAVCGVVGSGKSTVAEALADALEGVVVSSDRVRKRLAGLRPDEHVGEPLGEGFYDAGHKLETYAGMLERAAPALASGRSVVLDATFGQRAFRDAASRFAVERGATAWVVEVRCPEDVALARLVRRESEGRDPSDAGPSLYAPSVRAFEAPDEWPETRRAVVSTGTDGWRDEVAAIARQIATESRAPG